MELTFDYTIPSNLSGYKAKVHKPVRYVPKGYRYKLLCRHVQRRFWRKYK